MTQSEPKYKDPDRRDWITGIASLVIFVVVITLGSLLLFTDFWYLWPILVVGGVVILVLRQTRNYACRCRDCGYEFEITFLTNLLAPHGVDREGSWQWLKCPGCQQRTKVTVVKKVA